jgi:hypothetical protein
VVEIDKKMKQVILYRDVLLIPGFYFWWQQFMNESRTSVISLALGMILILVALSLPSSLAEKNKAAIYTLLFPKKPQLRLVGIIVEGIVILSISFVLARMS